MARTARSVNTATALALAGALLMTGCSSAQSSADEPATPAASKTPRPTDIPSPTPLPTLQPQPSGEATYTEVVLGSSEDQTAPGSFDSMASSTGRFKIVMSCQGSGELQVDMPDIGVGSTIPCDSDGSRVFANSFPSEVTDPFQVLVSGAGVERWSAEVIEDRTAPPGP
ncbi:hypothetical protein ACFFON_03665 [Arthrobacter citreus]|uniref:hypothetical protein n=1 Tax=Arthrobacter TaxID=1663 RepID=UPI001265523E|nr:hypothetical protein [Arthrobacter gandavensis]